MHLHRVTRAVSSLVASAIIALSALPALAQSGTPAQDTTGLDATAREAGLAGNAQQAPLETLVGRLIQTLLGFVGILFLLLTVYAGILWMTAQGDDTKVLKAKKLLSSAIIGLAIIVSAYAFTEFVVRAIYEAPNATSSDSTFNNGIPQGRRTDPGPRQ